MDIYHRQACISVEMSIWDTGKRKQICETQIENQKCGKSNIALVSGQEVVCDTPFLLGRSLRPGRLRGSTLQSRNGKIFECIYRNKARVRICIVVDICDWT